MTREIKFRAYDKKNKIMWNEGVYISLDGDLSFDGMKMVKWYNPFEFELMQFTGLLDKNGKEIYEGDIIIAYEEDEDSPSGRIHEHLGFIYWHEKECRYKYGTKKQKVLGEKDWHDYSEFPSYMCEHEVIGNIYEHGDLLNGKQ